MSKAKGKLKNLKKNVKKVSRKMRKAMRDLEKNWRIKCPHSPETFQTVLKPLCFVALLYCQNSNLTNWLKLARNKVPRLFGIFPNCPETFQTVLYISRLYGNLPDLFYVLSWFWANFVDTRKSFPDAQKLSSWQCQHANGVFLTLHWTWQLQL